MAVSYKEQQRRMHVWRHNSYFGHCRMALSNMKAIIDSDSTSIPAKELAAEITDKLWQLQLELKNRIDPENLP